MDSDQKIFGGSLSEEKAQIGFGGLPNPYDVFKRDTLKDV